MDIKQELKDLKHINIIINWPKKLRYETLSNQRQATTNKINNLDDKGQSDIMLLRYLIGLKWNEIAIKTNVSNNRLASLHKQALAKLSTGILNKVEQI